MIDPVEFVDRVLASGIDAVGHELNKVADAFRAGADLAVLRPLLSSNDSSTVCAAAWIVSEVANGIRGRDVFYEMFQLLGHEDAAVRFEALTAVAQMVTNEDAPAVAAVLGLLADSNVGVRRQAFALAARIDTSTLNAASRYVRGGPLLGQGARASEVRAALLSSDLLTRRVAAVAAIRSGDAELRALASVETVE